MHNYVAAQGSPHREEMRPSLQGEGDRGAGEVQDSRNKPRKETKD